MTTKWTLTAEEKAAITEKLDDKALLDRPVKIYRRYEDTEPQWELPISFKNAIEHLIEDERLNAIEKKPLVSAENTQALRSALEAIAERSEKQQRLLDRINKFSRPERGRSD